MKRTGVLVLLLAALFFWSAPQALAEEALARVRTNPCLLMLAEPDPNSGHATCIARNTVVTVVCTADAVDELGNRWVRLRHDGMTGFAPATALGLHPGAGLPAPCTAADGSPRPGVDFPDLRLALPRPPAPTRAHPQAVLTSFETLVNGCAVVRWQNCTDLGRHYLTGDGADFRIDLGALARADDGTRAAFDAHLASALQDVFANLESRPGDEPQLLPVDTGWRSTTVQDNDWRLGLGTIAIRVVGHLVVDAAGADGEQRAELVVRAFMVDVYDFSVCRGDDRFCVFRTLADLGHATEFLVYGAGETLTTTSSVTDLRTSPSILDW